MKYLILYILLFTTFISSGQALTFQDKLIDDLKTKHYRSNQLPYLDYSNEGKDYTLFWYTVNEKFFLIFVKNNEIFYVINCYSLPVGVEAVGDIEILPKEQYAYLTKTDFMVAGKNVMNDYNSVTAAPISTDIVKLEQYIEPVQFNGAFLPVVVNLEIPVLYYMLNDVLLVLPLEY